MPKFTIPRPVLLAAEAVAAGSVAAGLDAVTTRLASASGVPSVQTLLTWFAVGAATWAAANLRQTYAGMLAKPAPAPAAPDGPAPATPA